MDIAKYIGLFLLKNNFCYVHGLGNLVLKKKAASYNGEALNAPSYEVIVTQGGSIDDSLANFIATNEQISISKAANALREFSTQAKADLQAGKEVIIPSLGKFVGNNDGVSFVTDPHLQYTPRAIPTVKHVAKEHAEQRAAESKTTAYHYDEPASSGSTNWGKVLLVGGIAVVLIVAVVFGINYMNSQPKDDVVTEQPAEPVTEPVQTPAPVAVDSFTADTNAVANNTVQTANGMLSLRVILNEYKNNSAADKRAKKLTSFGNSVEVVMKDSSTFYVVMPVTAAATDTARVLDSLRRNFNPKGVSIYQ